MGKTILQILTPDSLLLLKKALDTVYSSHVLDLLQHKEGELYVQSPSYVYELLLKEKGLQVVNETVNGNR